MYSNPPALLYAWLTITSSEQEHMGEHVVQHAVAERSVTSWSTSGQWVGSHSPVCNLWGSESFAKIYPKQFHLFESREPYCDSQCTTIRDMRGVVCTKSK